MNISTKTKNIIKYVIICVICIALIAGAIAIISSIANRDGKAKLRASDFDIGDISVEGAYLESKGSIYTSECFPVDGLEIKIDFENTIDYQVFFYDVTGKFLSVSDTFDTDFSGDIPEGAEYFRVKIIPDWAELEIEDEEDMTISGLQIRSYAKQLTVTYKK